MSQTMKITKDTKVNKIAKPIVVHKTFLHTTGDTYKDMITDKISRNNLVINVKTQKTARESLDIFIKMILEPSKFIPNHGDPKVTVLMFGVGAVIRDKLTNDVITVDESTDLYWFNNEPTNIYAVGYKSKKVGIMDLNI